MRFTWFGLGVAVLLSAAACTTSKPADEQSAGTTTTTGTIMEAETTSTTAATSSSTTEPEGELPPLCTDFYPDLDIDGDLSADRFVADAQTLRAFYGWSTSEQEVRQLLASLDGANAFRGPYTEDEWATIRIDPDEPREPKRVWPDEATAAYEWLRSNDHPAGLYYPSTTTMVITYPAAAEPEFTALLTQAEDEIAARGPNDEHYDLTWREVDYSSIELYRLTNRLKQETSLHRVTPDLRANRVAVDLGIADPEDANRIPEELLPYVCLETPLPEGTYGPQPATGDGWRIVGITDNAISLDRSQYLTDRQTELDELWRSLEIPDPAPDVDFDNELVVVWDTTISANCDNWIRFENYTIESDQLNAQLTDFVYPYGCLAAAGIRHYIVAIDSNGLPPDIKPGELAVTRIEPDE